MSLIEWTDEKYSVGILKIDQQHQELVMLINMLGSQRGSTNVELVDEVLSTLNKYVRTHFRFEEGILERMHFPDLTAHREKHAQFIRKLHLLKTNFLQAKDTTRTLDAITNFLKEWLLNHIMIEDKAYGTYLIDGTEVKLGDASS